MARIEMLRTSKKNVPAQTVSWPNDPVQVRRPEGGIAPRGCKIQTFTWGPKLTVCTCNNALLSHWSSISTKTNSSQLLCLVNVYVCLWFQKIKFQSHEYVNMLHKPWIRWEPSLFHSNSIFQSFSSDIFVDGSPILVSEVFHTTFNIFKNSKSYFVYHAVLAYI